MEWKQCRAKILPLIISELDCWIRLTVASLKSYAFVRRCHIFLFRLKDRQFCTSNISRLKWSSFCRLHNKAYVEFIRNNKPVTTLLIDPSWRVKFWYWDMSQGAAILDRKVWLRKMPIGRIFGAQTTSAWTTVEIGVCSLDFVFWHG